MTETGLLGGTFNPLHRGHIELGLQISRERPCNRILYILSAYPPHKDSPDLAPLALRWNMLKEALSPYPHLIPCDLEMRTAAPSWTINTIREFKRSRPYSQDPVFICGSDGFLRVHTWKEYRTLLRETRFIVLLRDPDHRAGIFQLARREHLSVSSTVGGDADICLFSYHSPTLEISSTRIRERIRRHLGIDEWVPAIVQRMIKENNLYEK